MGRGVIIPKSTQLGNSVAPALALPQLRAEETGGQLLAQGGAKLASDLTNIAVQVKTERDETRTQEAFSELDMSWQTILAKDFLPRRGRDVLPNKEGRGFVVDDGLAKRDDMLRDALLTMDNDDQRRALSAAWNARSRFANERLLNHQVKEEEAYRDATDAAGIATRIQLIPTQSEGEVIASLADISSIIDGAAKRKIGRAHV